MASAAPEYQATLAHEMAGYTHDPLGFVEFAYPWGMGELSAHEGPRDWQAEELAALGDHLRDTPHDVYRTSVASGHGIGKSALVAWITQWALSTMPDARVVVTANTESQLREKTWAEMAKWHRMLITREWFECGSTAVYAKDENHKKTWRSDMVPWSERNPEAFAGLHNMDNRIVLIFDEASAIPDAIWEVAEGALTDENTEILWICFGNPTRNSGRFRGCFRKFKHRWRHQHIDSRTVEGTDLDLFKSWIDDYGEDSDFCRVRIRGVFPNAPIEQLIPLARAEAAAEREAYCDVGDPLIIGVDCSRGTSDRGVFYPRRGRDAKSIPPRIIPDTSDVERFVGRACTYFDEMQPDQIFIDGGHVGGAICDRLVRLGYPVVEVQFGGKADDDKRFANKRAEIWVRMNEFLKGGSIWDSEDLVSELTSPESGPSSKHADRLLLEAKSDMKKRGEPSPDIADALALTFAFPVAAGSARHRRGPEILDEGYRAPSRRSRETVEQQVARHYRAGSR